MTLTLDISNRGQGTLKGTVETNIDCLKVSPKKIDSTTDNLRITIDATGLRSGQYVCHLAVRTNGGDQTVPIRFAVSSPDDDTSGAYGLDG